MNANFNCKYLTYKNGYITIKLCNFLWRGIMSRVIIKDCKSYNVTEIKEKINDGINLLGGWDKFIKLV